MLRLIRTDIHQELPHSSLPFRHIPITNSNLRRLDTAAVPQRQFPSIKIGDGTCVGPHGFFFEVADEAVACSGGEEVADEEAIEEHALRAEDHGSHEDTGSVEFEEGEEVHALVEGFFDESFDPVYVSECAIDRFVKNEGERYQPLSRFILRRLCKCLNIPPTIPGTPATLSRKIKRTSHFDSVISNFLVFFSPAGISSGCLYPVAVSIPQRRKRIALSAILSEKDSVSRWETLIFSISFSVKTGCFQVVSVRWMWGAVEGETVGKTSFCSMSTALEEEKFRDDDFCP